MRRFCGRDFNRWDVLIAALHLWQGMATRKPAAMPKYIQNETMASGNTEGPSPNAKIHAFRLQIARHASIAHSMAG